MIPRPAARPLLVELLPPESSAAPGTAGAVVAVGVLDMGEDDDKELVRG